MTASVLLHLVHPYALRNLKSAIGHVKRFQEQVNPLSPKAETAQIAKDALMDVVDTSGVSLAVLLPLLEELEKGVPQLPGEGLELLKHVSI